MWSLCGKYLFPREKICKANWQTYSTNWILCRKYVQCMWNVCHVRYESMPCNVHIKYKFTLHTTPLNSEAKAVNNLPSKTHGCSKVTNPCQSNHPLELPSSWGKLWALEFSFLGLSVWIWATVATSLQSGHGTEKINQFTRLSFCKDSGAMSRKWTSPDLPK